VTGPIVTGPMAAGPIVTGSMAAGPMAAGPMVTGPTEGLDAPPDPADEVPVRQCGRCGGVSTHYLTCPALKLPPGYRISDPERGPR
jgi:hypothetical protein